MQESDRSMLVEYWLSKLLVHGLQPLCYARPQSETDDALVAFLLPVDDSQVKDGDCEITLDPGPPCLISFSFFQEDQVHRIQVIVDEESGCPAGELTTAARQVDRFWLFINQSDYQGLSLYEIGWNPVIND